MPNSIQLDFFPWRFKLIYCGLWQTIWIFDKTIILILTPNPHKQHHHLLPSSAQPQLKLQLSWAEFALFPLSPTDHPPTHPPWESLFLKLQQVLMVRNFVWGPAQPSTSLICTLAGLSLLYFHFLQPTTHPPTQPPCHPTRESLFLKLQQVLILYAAQLSPTPA